MTKIKKGTRVVFRGPDDGFGIGRGRHGVVVDTYSSHKVAIVRWDDTSDRRWYAKHGNARFEDLEEEKT